MGGQPRPKGDNWTEILNFHKNLQFLKKISKNQRNVHRNVRMDIRDLEIEQQK